MSEKRITFVPRVPVAVDSKPLPPPAERLAAALQKVREQRDTMVEGYGFGHPESHFIDYAGIDSSAHMWETLVSIASMLRMPQVAEWHLFDDGYNQRTGEFILARDKVNISIEILRASITARILELGLAPHLVFEWMATPHSFVDEQAWNHLSFEKRMARFKAA
jgi:hypothetical protein